MQGELIPYVFPSCLPFVNETEALMATLICLTSPPWCPMEFILPLSFVQMFHSTEGCSAKIPGTNLSCALAWHRGKNGVDLEGPGLHINLLLCSSNVFCEAEGRQPSSWCSAAVLCSGTVAMPTLSVGKGGPYDISVRRKN